MKQIVTTYSYSPTTNVVTLTGVNIEQDQLLLVVAPQVGRTMYNFASGVTGSVVAGADTRVTLNASTVGLTTTSPLVIFYDDQAAAQSVTGTVALDPASLVALENVTVTIGSSVSISNFPSTQTVAGTVTANAGDFAANFSDSPANRGVQIGYENSDRDSFRFVTLDDPLPVILRGSQLSDGQTTVTQPVAGTVTASLADVTDPLQDNGTSGKSVAVKIYDLNGLPIGPQSRIPVSGSVTLGIGTSQIGTVTVGALPNGSLTTRFGSVTTANTAQITSAVTNASRKFLLV
ncbi:hypothetical protein EBZ80_26320, partial [bacterium]|nr:hypothetical protein [bacterium]